MRVKLGLGFGPQGVQYTQCGSHLVCVLCGSDHPAQTCQGVSQEAQGPKEGTLGEEKSDSIFPLLRFGGEKVNGVPPVLASQSYCC